MALFLAEIDAALPKIEPLLLALIDRDRTGWTVDDVVEYCRSGKWLLMMADDDAGFCLFSVDGNKRLRIEAMCHPNGERTVSDYLPFMQIMARNMGCDEIVMESKRRGWERLGWVPGFTTYTMRVQEVSDAQAVG